MRKKSKPYSAVRYFQKTFTAGRTLFGARKIIDLFHAADWFKQAYVAAKTIKDQQECIEMLNRVKKKIEDLHKKDYPYLHAITPYPRIHERTLSVINETMAMEEAANNLRTLKRPSAC